MILTAGFLVKTALASYRKTQPGLKILNYDAKSIFLGIKDVYLGPRKLKARDLLILAAMAFTILSLYRYDEEISNWFRRRGETALVVLKNFGWYYGSPENHYMINAGFYLYGFFFRNEEVRKAGTLLITSSLAAGLLQTILKIITGRARPLREEGKFSFKPGSRENSYYSFPSGHSILSFTTAYALATQVRQPAL
ncbi:MULTISPECIES: phosphatase PAP2 family protein [Antarcticibacterium]|uniref:phosphatase PAP2 family protein n=1 Tax=Antarcticibacterium TaxID=2058174 RepID=UPI00143DAE44|nr:MULTISPECIES: phosphatase PAP2 family protein [Antarcticibacterium]